MRVVISILLFLLCVQKTYAQLIAGSTTETRSLYKESQKYFQQKDYTSASIVLTKAIKLEPENMIFLRDLSLNYFLLNKYESARVAIEHTLQLPDADVACYTLAMKIYEANGDVKSLKKTLNKGIEKVPNSGELYAAKADLFYKQGEYKEALRAWEKGIEVDPTYQDNYYHAAKMYIKNPNEIIKPIVYSESFINLESFTARTEEMKRILYDGFFKMIFFINNDTTGLYNSSNALKDFPSAVYNTFKDVSHIVTEPLDINTIMQLRIRFLLDWNKTYDEIFPYALFDYHNTLLLSGNFEAYTQWLFGREADGAEYKKWALKNAKALNDLLEYIQKKEFTPKPKQYYFTGL